MHKWQVMVHNIVIDCLPICCMRCVYKYGARHRPLYREIHLFLATLLRCRRPPHPVIDVPSVSGEQAPKPTSPRVPARGRGRIRFLGSAVATARWTSSSLYARCFSISIDGLRLLPILPSHRQPHYKDVYPLSVVQFHIIFIPSTRSREFDSNCSASFDSYICDTCC